MFKDRLRQARSSAGLMQIEFAEALGVSSSTIAGYEIGRSEPDFQRLVDMMKVLNVDANFLFLYNPPLHPPHYAQK